MRFMVRAQEYNDGAWSGWAWVALDDAAIKGILEKRELFQMVKSKSAAIYEMWFWSHPTYFFEDGDVDVKNFLTAVEITEFETKGFLCVPDERTPPGDMGGFGFGCAPAGVDHQHLIISDHGVSFYGCLLERIVRNVRTDEISYELFLK